MFPNFDSPLTLAIIIIDLAGLLAATIMCLDVVWRTRGQLDIFAKLLSCALLLRFTDRLFDFLQFALASNGKFIWIGFLEDALLLAAATELYHMVRTLDGENIK